jgi:GT2 family glycosyltransferase/lipopolysaccharide/colanic/teichoic acid biosynthesis glycosyltransferase
VKLSIIIVSYNSRAVLKPCLASLGAQSLAHESEIIVVDNASADGCPAMVAREFPSVRLIANRENVGYSKGVNLGIRAAQGDFFLILNPDTVVGERAIETLLDFMETKTDAGIVGPKLVFFDGTIQYSCRRFYTWNVLLLRRTFLGKIFKNSKAVARHLMLDYDHKTTEEVDWILGACMLVRRQAVESVGLMDERFFLYFEDVDWCYRMKQKGWKVYYHPESVISHGYARESAQSVLNRSMLAHLVSLVRYYEKWDFILYFLKKYREIFKIAFFLAIDVVAFNLAFFSAYYLRVNLHEVFPNPIFPIVIYRQFVLFENLLFVATFVTLGLYRVRRETSYVDELFKIGQAITLASVLLMASTYLSQIRIYSRMIVAFLVPFAISYDWLLRTLVRAIHKRLLKLKIDLKRIVIIGPVEGARALEQRLSLETNMGFDVVGIVATDEIEQSILGGGLGSLSDIEQIVDKYRAQELMVLHNAVSPEQLSRLVSMGRKRVLDITVMTDFSDLVIHKATVGNVMGRPVIAYHRDARYALDRFTKRGMDIVLGALFIVVSAPLYVVYSIYSMSRGKKAITRETRLGLNAEPVALPVAGESGHGAAGRGRDGTSDLVNLPLFIEVVAGKLSMVGPYPFPVDEVHLLERAHQFRFDVRPGVTGYWRIGADHTIPLDALLAQDAGYIRNWSLVVDVKILIRTLANIILGRKTFLTIRDS